MNSIQLISKINARIEDLAMLSQEVLKPNSELSNIEKEVLKRTCSDLFELVLKLKTSNDLTEEQIALKENINQEIRKEEHNFKTMLANKVKEDFTINTLAEKEQEKHEFAWEPIVPNIENQVELEPEIATNNIVEQEEKFEEEIAIQTPIISEAVLIPTIETLEVQKMNPTIQDEVMEENSFPLMTDNHYIAEELVSEENVTEETVTEETVIENNIIEPLIQVFESAPIVEQIMEVAKPIIPIAPTIATAPIAVNIPLESEPEKVQEKAEPIKYEATTPKPTPFFSIAKTVLPKSEGSLNEKLAQKIDSFQFSEKIIEPKIDSLKTAISLNKKIAFVNDLFKENVVEYAKSIDKINNSSDLNEAMLVWTEMKIAHNWKSDNTLMHDLEKLIQRRFS